jgi:hypothetical protein
MSSWWEVLEVSGALRDPWGELRLIHRLVDPAEQAAESTADDVLEHALPNAA